MRPIRSAALLALVAALPAAAQQAPYKVAVTSESGDIVTWVTPGAGTLAQDRVVPVGVMPADIDGPHNITMSPDRKSYYVSIAHGTPFGTLWRYDAATDTVIGRANVEFYPTTIALTPDGELAFVANSDFHGDRPRVNMLSIVHTPTMTKITDLPVCDMPHGVKVTRDGLKVWVTCMHDDEILEVDVGTFSIVRRAKVGTGGGMAGMDHGAMPAMNHSGHGAPGATAPMPSKAPAGPVASPAPRPGECSPTFISLSADDRQLFVACNYGNSVQVWDAASLTMLKEIPVGKGAYNVEPSPDGKWIIATNKKDQSVSVIDRATLTVKTVIPTTKKIVHGVGYSPDSRYAFITAESIGADPGSLDMIDLSTMTKVATLPLPAQPTGVTVWTPTP